MRGQIAAGLLAGPAAFIASGTMAAACIQFQRKSAVNASFFSAINHGELAMVCAFAFLIIAPEGDGDFREQQA